MTNEPGSRPDLERKLSRFWKQHGYRIERVEVGEVPLSNQGTILCANFLPEANVSDVNGATEEMVRLLFAFLIVKRHSKGHIGIQSAVNVRLQGSDPEQFVVFCKYWTDEDKLRYLEKQKKQTLEHLSIDELTSGKHEVATPPPTEMNETKNRALPLPQ